MSANDIDLSSIEFDIKTIRWSEYSYETPILLQDKNGPCPLIALINTLLLKYEIQNKRLVLNEVNYSKTDQHKIENVGNLKQFLVEKAATTGVVRWSDLSNVVLELIRQFTWEHDSSIHEDLLKYMNTLVTGLTVDPNLIDGSFRKEEYSKEGSYNQFSPTLFFEVFDLELKHGWCVNRIDNEHHDFNSLKVGDEDNYGNLVDLVENLQTFDKIQDYLSIDADGEDIAEEDKITTLQNQRLLRSWLNSNQTQLTNIGLQRLNMSIAQEEFIVFFRNNHFNTLFKKDDSEFYLLITDNAFKDKSIVWQSLNSVSGIDDLFFDGEFLPVLNDNIQIESAGDYLLTKQLQEEEDADYAKKIQAQYDKKPSSQKKDSISAEKTKGEKNSPKNGEKKKGWFPFSKRK